MNRLTKLFASAVICALPLVAGAQTATPMDKSSTGKVLAPDQPRSESERKATAENGQVVVALIDGNYATVKKFYREPDFIRLEPANPQFKPIFIKTPGRVQLQGVVRGLIRSYSTPS